MNTLETEVLVWSRLFCTKSCRAETRHLNILLSRIFFCHLQYVRVHLLFVNTLETEVLVWVRLFCTKLLSGSNKAYKCFRRRAISICNSTHVTQHESIVSSSIELLSEWDCLVKTCTIAIFLFATGWTRANNKILHSWIKHARFRATTKTTLSPRHWPHRTSIDNSNSNNMRRKWATSTSKQYILYLYNLYSMTTSPQHNNYRLQ